MTEHFEHDDDTDSYDAESYDDYEYDDYPDNSFEDSRERIFRNFVYFGIIILSFITTLSLLNGSANLAVLGQFRVQFATAAFCLVTLAWVVRTNHMAWMVGLILLAINLVPVLGIVDDPGTQITIMAGDIYEGFLALKP